MDNVWGQICDEWQCRVSREVRMEHVAVLRDIRGHGTGEKSLEKWGKRESFSCKDISIRYN